MNVLHISPRLRPGGVNRLAADLACGLQQAGFRNTVISPPNELVGKLTADSVPHHSSRNIAVFTYLRELKRVQRLVCNTKTDIILAYTTPAANLAWRACKNMPEELRPRIIGIHTTFPRHPGWKASLERCDALVAISRHLRSELTERSRRDSEQDIWVIPYGVNEKLCFPGYRPSDTWIEQWMRTHKEAEGTLSVCIPGAITPLHGLEDLVPILAKLKSINVPVHVYIAGDTARADKQYLKKLHHLYRQTGIADNITWLGLRSDLRDVICICDVVLSLAKAPASHDRVVLEALALGRPVAGYDHGAVGELLDSFLPEGRVAPNDINGITERLEQWQAYRPYLNKTLPYPYRLQDTIRSIAELCTSLCQTSNITSHR